MKQKLLLMACACAFATHSFATTHTIAVGPNNTLTFTPNSGITVPLGDTVMWVWATGTHNTTSAAIPSGAVSWAQPINSGATTFRYVPAVLGTYNYTCTFHSGMTGSFVVATTTHVSPVSAPVFTMYPNPVAGTLHLQFSAATPAFVTITDMTGKIVNKYQYNNTSTADLNLSSIPNGVYVVNAVQEGKTYKQQLVVAH